MPSGSPGEKLLTALGYRIRWNSWVLELPEGRAIEAQPLPDGCSITVAESEEARRTVWTVTEDAFLEWSVRDRQSFEDFGAQVWLRPGFEPWNLRCVTDAGGTVVGASLVQLADGCGYIARLAVRRRPARSRLGPGAARRLVPRSP